MKPRHAVVTAILALALALAGCDQLLHRSEGEVLWRKSCAECHGLNGSGNTPRYMSDLYADLTDNEWHAGGNDAAMESVIVNGAFGKMQGFPQLKDEEIKALLDYIHVLRGEKVRTSS